MTLDGYVREGVRMIQAGGLTAVRDILARGYFWLKPGPDGTNVYDRDWDVLVVLDACRADALAAAAADRDWIEKVEAITSVGGHSREWMDRTVAGAPDQELERTAYITGNPFSAEMTVADAFGMVDEVWRYGWDDDLGIIPARPLTDRAITVGREDGYDRLIVHYMQPHFPAVTHDGSGGLALEEWGDRDVFIWDEIRSGKRTVEEARDLYRDNLDYVLDDIALLAENIDGDMVITADHGNAFGEGGVYGHVPGVALPAVRRVPWGFVDASDGGGHEPATYDRDVEEGNIRDRLTAL
ncbi:MAG: hypothetical protein ABEK12_03935, partial [Candidatus Nanohaloarchaea archaeon]